MLSADTTEFQSAIADLQAAHRLPEGLSPRQLQLLQASFNRYANEVGQRLLDDVLGDFQTKITQALSATTDSQGGPGASRSSALYNLTAHAGEDIAERLRFGMGVAQEVVAGAGRYLNQNISAAAVQEYPALALQRMFQRAVPRGFKRSGKSIVAVPDDDWPSRWAEAAAQTEDHDWLPWEGSAQAGRGVALKRSGIWQILGTLRDDSLGNPFPPFAFGSGFMTKEVPLAETISLGLLSKGENVTAPEINLERLFNFNS